MTSDVRPALAGLAAQPTAARTNSPEPQPEHFTHGQRATHIPGRTARGKLLHRRATVAAPPMSHRRAALAAACRLPRERRQGSGGCDGLVLMGVGGRLCPVARAG